MAQASYAVFDAPSSQRIIRPPQHRFALQTRPWQLQPFLCAPVIPGESMKSLLCQARVVTDPLKSSITGWWCEFYFFYVKVSDLDQTGFMPGITDLFLDPQFDITPYLLPANADCMYAGMGLPWVEQCLNLVVKEYFRDPGDVRSRKLGTMPVCAINEESYLNSVARYTEVQAADMNVDLNADATIKASEVDKAMRLYNTLLMGGLTQMSYSDFLKSYGVSVPSETMKRPELIRYVRDWTYPANTVNPADGKPSSAAVWSMSERADKARFFREPGFIFGLTTTRPKVYPSNVRGCASEWLDNAFSWLPAVLSQDPQTSIRKYTGAQGPVANAGGDYVIDMKDLFIHGDFFWNVMAAGTRPTVALPAAETAPVELNQNYPSATDADALFSVSANHFVRTEGIVSLNIAGTQVDTTPTGPDA